MAVVMGVIAFMIFKYLMDALDTTSWNTGEIAMMTIIVPLVLAVGVVVLAFGMIKKGFGG